MDRAILVTRWIVRLAGIVQIVLGVLFWTGRALPLLPVHMVFGMVVVFGLWLQAGFGARAGLSRATVLHAVLLGLAVPILGVTQAGLLPGSFHWIIQVVHLVLGLGALRLAEQLATQMLRREGLAWVPPSRGGAGEAGFDVPGSSYR